MNYKHVLKTSLLAISAYSICFGMKPEQTQLLGMLGKNFWDNCDVAAIQNILNKGFAVNMQNQEGWTLLHAAAYYGKQDIVKYLLSKNASLNSRNNEGNTPLHIAAKLGHDAIVIELLKHGADIEAQNNILGTPLYTAIFKGHVKIAELLLQHGANKEARMQHGNTPLHIAASFNHAKVVELLLQYGADKEARNQREVTPLHLATDKGNTEIVKLLLSHNAEINSSFQDNNHTITPLGIALSKNNSKIMGLLLDYGAQIPNYHPLVLARLNQVQNNKCELRKALHSQDSFRRVKELLKQGAYANEAVQHLLNAKYRALLNAVDSGNVEAVQKLSQEGLSLALCDSNGNSLLHRAVLKEHVPMIEYLLSIGSDPGVYNKQGLTPVALAAQKEHLLNVFFKYCKDNTWQDEATHDDKRLKKR